MIQFIEVFKHNEIKIEQIAEISKIVRLESYHDVLSEEQIIYTLNFFQNKECITKDIKSKGYRYFLIKKDETTIGFFGIKNKYRYLLLKKFYILKEYRNKGYGKIAFNKIKDILIEYNLSSIHLYISKKNKKMIDLFFHLGFKIIRDSILYIGSNFVMNDYILEYDLDEF